MPARTSSGVNSTTAMTVKNTGFLLDRLGQDCHPLQFLRELTQNSIEAIQKAGGPGEIIWDVDWKHFEMTGVRKLAIIDTGNGMSGSNMVDYINQLSSSASEQSFSGNYGVGAKIAAATRNRAGMVYLSWKDGQGSMIHLWRNPEDGVYGLKRWDRGEELYTDFMEIEDEIKPSEIKDRGTKIVLLGNADKESTVQAPEGAAAPSRWIAKYLNSRYYRFPEGIKIKAREGWEYPRSDSGRNKLRTITGQEKYLREHADASGSVNLEGATAHWWILKNTAATNHDSNYFTSSGHVAALYQNELYEMATARAGSARLQQFGVIFGPKWVVIYVEPTDEPTRRLTTNTARTNLLINNEPLPWADWAAEFRDKMPPEIERFVKDTAAGSTAKDHTESIRERLKPILDLYKVSRYRPTPEGSVMIDEEQTARGGKPASGSGSGGNNGSGNGGRKGGTTGNIYALFEKKGGTPGQKVYPDPFPIPTWISVADGTRDVGLLEDRAARYIIDQNRLLINADFRVFTDMIAKWHKEAGGGSAVKETVVEVVHSWFEQALMETVIGVQALRNSKEWTHQDIQMALSDEALTTAVMQRYHVNYNVKRELSAKLGKLQPA